jgi:hypothetical protein
MSDDKMGVDMENNIITMQTDCSYVVFKESEEGRLRTFSYTGKDCSDILYVLINGMLMHLENNQDFLLDYAGEHDEDYKPVVVH